MRVKSPEPGRPHSRPAGAGVDPFSPDVARAAPAFTLVELMVVVSLIALLLSILMPSMNTARSVARRVACAANLRQVGIGMVNYWGDSRWRFLSQANASQMTFGGHPGTYSGYRSVDGYSTNKRPLNRYVQATGLNDNDDVPLFRCSADTGAPGWDSRSVTTYLDVGTSYLYNRFSPTAVGTLNPTPIVNKSMAVNDVRSPAFTVLLADHPLFNFASNGDRRQRWHDLSKPTGNVNYIDGHVQYADVVYSVTGDTKDYTWYPDK